MSKPTGYILTEQNGVVCVVTGFGNNSTNRKTGPMLQSYILVADEDPVMAARTGAESKVCGDCGLRKAGLCFVPRFQAPKAVWDKYRHDGYRPMNWSALKGHSIRIGTFGDPAFVPSAVWEKVVNHCSGHVGYTHQWRKPNAQDLRKILMASVESEAEQAEAVAAGWRTFRVRSAAQPLLANELVCPASTEAGKRTTCSKCLLCAGQSKPAKSIAIVAHGARAKKLGNLLLGSAA